MSENSSFEKEFSNEEIKNAVQDAFTSAFLKYTELGEAGLEPVQKNQFGDMALRMDIEAEAAVIESLTKQNIPVRIISEEHGTIDIGTPQFLAVLDGIDGTALYKKEPLTGKYGTMIGFFRGTDPTYADYILGGIMQHATERMLVGKKGEGAFAIKNGAEAPIHTSGATTFDKNSIIYIDEYWETNRNTFSEQLSGFNTSNHLASSLYYGDVAEGLADLALECTRKDNLEIAAAYALIKEAGGVIVDMNGEDIGTRKYFEFGKGEEHIPVITAATRELAENLIKFLRE